MLAAKPGQLRGPRNSVRIREVHSLGPLAPAESGRDLDHEDTSGQPVGNPGAAQLKRVRKSPF